MCVRCSEVRCIMWQCGECIFSNLDGVDSGEAFAGVELAVFDFGRDLESWSSLRGWICEALELNFGR